MAIDYVALKTEIQTDPNTYGYAAMVAAGNMQGVADALNRVRASIDIPRHDVTPQEVLEAIAVAHFISNPNTLYASWFESITQLPMLRILNADGTDSRVMTNLMAILTNGSLSETRLRNLAKRKGSRAEQLFGVGTFLGWQDITQALAS